MRGGIDAELHRTLISIVLGWLTVYILLVLQSIIDGAPPFTIFKVVLIIFKARLSHTCRANRLCNKHLKLRREN